MPPARKKRRARRRTGSGRPWKWLLAVFFLVSGAVYVGYLDRVVRLKFEGSRWALPARVYARPLELYAGAPVRYERLLAELQRLGYRRAAHAMEPGSYALAAGQIELHSRGFLFSDGEEPPARVLVDFDAGQISTLQTLQGGAAVELLRLDPVMIGSFYPASNEDRLLVQWREVPELLVHALLAMEDRQFYQHHGVSPRGIARALLADLKAGKVVQGGSTLTQQLVKNFYLDAERSLVRKLNEAAMAGLLELHYNKEEILEAYLNEVFLGQAGRRSVHGFAQGSQLFFGRPLAELSPGQMALLAGMVKAPSAYNPRRNPEQAKARRDLVLGVLAEQGFISPAAARSEQRQPLNVPRDSEIGLSRYPDFLDLVRRQLRRDYPDQVLRSEGLRIFSTLDPAIQGVVEAVVVERARRLAVSTGAGEQLQAAMVVADVVNSEVLALVGSRTPRNSGFNRALDAERSIGSLIKPAVYLTALAQADRYHLDVTLLDEPLEVPRQGREPWRPENADHRYRGSVPLLDGLLHSLNVPTARLGLALGVPAVANTLRQLGISRPINPNPSLLLGALGLSPLEVNQFYLTVAAGGFLTPQRAILSVTDRNGATLSRYALRVEQTVEPRATHLLQMALQETVRRGTARTLQQWLDPALHIAAKTGTTNDSRDSWFAGYSANLSAVAWVGRDDNRSTGLYGATGALPLWAEVMKQLPLLANQPTLVDGITWLQTSPGRAAIIAPAAAHCPGGYGIPVMAEFTPAYYTPCGSTEPDPQSSPETKNALQWFLDKMPWSID